MLKLEIFCFMFFKIIKLHSNEFILFLKFYNYFTNLLRYEIAVNIKITQHFINNRIVGLNLKKLKRNLLNSTQDPNLMRSQMKIFLKSSYPRQKYGAVRASDIKKISLRVLFEIFYKNLFEDSL